MPSSRRSPKPPEMRDVHRNADQALPPEPRLWHGRGAVARPSPTQFLPRFSNAGRLTLWPALRGPLAGIRKPQHFETSFEAAQQVCPQLDMLPAIPRTPSAEMAPCNICWQRVHSDTPSRLRDANGPVAPQDGIDSCQTASRIERCLRTGPALLICATKSTREVHHA
jgi:hypothetical protein